MNRPQGRVSRSYVTGYRDGWDGVAYLDRADNPGRYDEEYDRGRSAGWLAYKRDAHVRFGVCDPDTCICNYCQGGPDGPW